MSETRRALHITWPHGHAARVTYAGVALVIVVGGVATRSALEAHATVGDLTCSVGTAGITVSPGITSTAKEVSATGTGKLSTCVSVSHPSLLGGTFNASGSGKADCINGVNGTGAGTITYNTGETSTVSGTLTLTISPQTGFNGFFNGTVTGGLFKGDSVSASGSAAFNPADCATSSGVTNVVAAISSISFS